MHDAAAAAAEDNLSDSSGDDSEDSGDVSASDVLQPLVFHTEQNAPKKRLDKKLALWRNWALKLIPDLLDPYLGLLRESENLKNIDRRLPQCSCDGSGHKMNVIAVFLKVSCFLVKMSACNN